MNAYSLRQAVNFIVKPLFKQQGLTESLLILEWKSIVGEQYAGVVEFEKIKFPKDKKTEGILYLFVERSMALFIQHSQVTLMEKINSFFGYKAVTRFVFKQVTLRQKPPQASEKTLNISQRDHLLTTLKKEEKISKELKNTLEEMANLLCLEP
jgi:hypothetical protein